jgi:hypothetical protein
LDALSISKPQRVAHRSESPTVTELLIRSFAAMPTLRMFFFLVAINIAVWREII